MHNSELSDWRLNLCKWLWVLQANLLAYKSEFEPQFFFLLATDAWGEVIAMLQQLIKDSEAAEREAKRDSGIGAEETNPSSQLQIQKMREQSGPFSHLLWLPGAVLASKRF